MLDTIDLSFAISKQAFKPMRREMLQRIFELSEMVYERKRPVIIVFEGWDAAGKGTTIRTLTQQLDARGYKVLPTQAARTHEKQKPWLWRFWMNIPRYGQIAIFDRSWYGRVLVERAEGLTPSPSGSPPTKRSTSSSGRWPTTARSSSNFGCTSAKRSSCAGSWN